MAGRHDAEVMMILFAVRVVVKPERKKENVINGKGLQFRGYIYNARGKVAPATRGAIFLRRILSTKRLPLRI